VPMGTPALLSCPHPHPHCPQEPEEPWHSLGTSRDGAGGEAEGRGSGAELRSGPERLSLSLGSAASAPAEQSTCFPSHCRGLPGIWDALVSLVLFDSVNSVNSRSSSIAAVAFSLGSNYLPALCPSPSPGAHAARGRPARGSRLEPFLFSFSRGCAPPSRTSI